jgi:NADH-quinone oxidoreductase subunit C
MKVNEMYERLKSEFGDSILELVQDEKSDSFIIVDGKDIVDISLFLRDEEDLLFDYPVILSGMDLGKQLGVVYHLYSLKYKHRIVLKVIVDKESPEVESVEKVWKSMNWHEREAYDMFGIIFKEHPDLRRILSPYDWEGYPLRKDYKEPEKYHGMKVPY